MLPTLLPILVFSTSLIHASLLPRQAAQIPAESLSKNIKYVYITEYSSVYARPYPTTAPPPPPPTSVHNFTKTSVVVVTTTLNATESSCSVHHTPPGLSSVQLKPSSLIGTGGLNWRAPSSSLRHGPGVPGSAPSGNVDPSNLPKFSYAPLLESGRVSVVPSSTSLKLSMPPGVAVPAPTTAIPLVPVKTTAIVVVPIYPPSTAIVVVPTHPPGAARGMYPTRPSHHGNHTHTRFGNGHWVNHELGPVNVTRSMEHPIRTWTGRHMPAQIADQTSVVRQSREGGDKSTSKPEVYDAIETMIPDGIARMIPRATDTTIEVWEAHKHTLHNVDNGEFGAIIPVPPSMSSHLPGKHDEDETESLSVSPSAPTNTNDEVDDVTSMSTSVTKTLQRSPSSTPFPTATPTGTATLKPTRKPSPKPSARAPPPSSSKPAPQSQDIHTSVLTPDHRCPYPYPGAYCGKPKTTLITVTKAPRVESSAAPSSKEERKEKTSKAWCPYPGQDC